MRKVVYAVSAVEALIGVAFCFYAQPILDFLRSFGATANWSLYGVLLIAAIAVGMRSRSLSIPCQLLGFMTIFFVAACHPYEICFDTSLSVGVLWLGAFLGILFSRDLPRSTSAISA